MCYQTADNWADRHSRWIRRRKTKALAKGRVSDGILADCAAFCRDLKAASEHFKMTADNVINYDETRVMVGKSGEYRLERVGKERGQVRKDKAKTLGSLLTFASAAGHVLMSVWIIKGKKRADMDKALLGADFCIADTKYELRSDVPRYYAFTESGYSNKHVHKSAIETFCKIWQLRHPGMHCYLLGDQLDCHKKTNIIKAALEKDVFMWLLPANTSHFLQPLDHAVFGLFKKKIGTAHVGVRLRGDETSSDALKGLYGVAYDAERSALMPRVIKKAFKATGIYPLDEARIMKLARDNAGELERAVDTELELKCASIMRRALEARVQAAKPATPVRAKKALLRGNAVFSPDGLIAADAAARAEAAEAKAKTKKKRQDAAAAKKARTCHAVKCKVECKSARQRLKWSHCSDCGAIYCTAHGRAFDLHIRKHVQETQPVPMDVV